jgi:hypothetical protein
MVKWITVLPTAKRTGIQTPYEIDTTTGRTPRLGIWISNIFSLRSFRDSENAVISQFRILNVESF